MLCIEKGSGTYTRVHFGRNLQAGVGEGGWGEEWWSELRGCVTKKKEVPA